MNSEVLLVDDNPRVLEQTLRALQTKIEARVQGAATAETALILAKQLRPQVAIIDLQLREGGGVDEGLQLLRDLKALDPTIRITVLTGYEDSETGARCIKAGASHFITKPAMPATLAVLVTEGIKESLLLRSVEGKAGSESSKLDTSMVAKAPSMQTVVEDIVRASKNKSPVLLLGETGTGKSVAARAIHALSERSERPFIRFQPVSSSLELNSSGLFGHLKGSFTGAVRDSRGAIAQADRGTFFLDEIDELPLPVQVSLLGVLQDFKYKPLGSDKEFKSSFRLISASNRPIDELIEGEKLREDLFHRVARTIIKIPPLRERLEDIPALVQRILVDVSESCDIQVYEASPDAIDALQGHPFRGNIRELEGIVEQAALRASEDLRRVIHPSDINFSNFKVVSGNSLPLSSDPKAMSEGSLMERAEAWKREVIRESFKRNGGNISAVSRELATDRRVIIPAVQDLRASTDKEPLKFASKRTNKAK